MLSLLGGGARDVIVAVDSDAVDREAGCAEAGVDSSSGIAVVCCPRVGPVVVEPLCFVSFFLLFFLLFSPSLSFAVLSFCFPYS